jgi:hypothetical protein
MMAVMSRAITTQTDAVALIQGLDADQIARRLEELDAEAQALRVLLRSARARERARTRRQLTEVSHVE